MKQDFIQQVAANIHVPAANTAAVVTLAAGNYRNGVSKIVASYSAAPTGGRLTITDGATTVFDVDVLSGGPVDFDFDPPLAGSMNTALAVTLAAGGAGISGKLNILPEKL